jgi:hypothetical protein
MTEEILRILLSDLAMVRIKCAGCGVVSEMPISKLGTAFGFHKKCPHCPQELSPGLLRGLAGLAECITDLAKDDMTRQATVEFVSRPTARP